MLKYRLEALGISVYHMHYESLWHVLELAGQLIQQNTVCIISDVDSTEQLDFCCGDHGGVVIRLCRPEFPSIELDSWNYIFEHSIFCSSLVDLSSSLDSFINEIKK